VDGDHGQPSLSVSTISRVETVLSFNQGEGRNIQPRVTREEEYWKLQQQVKELRQKLAEVNGEFVPVN